MYYIEHSGTENHTIMANNVKAILNGLGQDVQHLIGRNWDDIIIYNRHMKQMAVFNTQPSLNTLEFLINMDEANEDSIY